MVLNLFKYFSPYYNDELNLSFYTRQAIFFQNPIRFNDPWDCKAPQISIPRQINALEEIWYKMNRLNSKEFADSEWNRIKDLPRPEIQKRFLNFFYNAIDKQRSKIGVFSLSFVPDSELMWSHYASSHTGYAIHFQIDLAQSFNEVHPLEFGVFAPVEYKAKREQWSLHEYYQDREKCAFNLVRHKSKVWNYECELRIINVQKSGFIKYPQNWLKSIIIGDNVDPALRKKLYSIGQELNINTYSASLNPNEYKIDIHGLGITYQSGKESYEAALRSEAFKFK